MLKLARRPVTDFLGVEHREGLAARVASAEALAADVTRTSGEKSKAIRGRWDDFRAGRTSKGTFAALWRELRAMAFDKCAFCETPGPGTVEHLDEKSAAPQRAFDWANLLPACDTCNRTRENSGIATRPLDPSAVEPLDSFGWDEYGDFAPAPAYRELVADVVRMYGLHRFREERRKAVTVFRALLAALVNEGSPKPDTLAALRAMLTGTSAHLGPIREYLLRPPTDDDAFMVRGAVALVPELRTLVAPWLRPPAWAADFWR